jgi:hypothetical protein
MGPPTTTTDRPDVRRDLIHEHVVLLAYGVPPRAWRATRARA